MQAELKLWSIRGLYVEAGSAEAAALWLQRKENRGDVTAADAREVTEMPGDYGEVVRGERIGHDTLLVVEWFDERDALAAATPGTPEYRAAVEAAGQLTLDELAGEAKP